MGKALKRIMFVAGLALLPIAFIIALPVWILTGENAMFWWFELIIELIEDDFD